jgi:hypothetical protein
LQTRILSKDSAPAAANMIAIASPVTTRNNWKNIAVFLILVVALLNGRSIIKV